MTILFKDKDTCTLDCNTRVRTVIGASREGKSHPFKRALQAVNHVGFFLMSKKNHKGMWLKKFYDLVPELRKKSAQMKSAYAKHTAFMSSNVI